MKNSPDEGRMAGSGAVSAATAAALLLAVAGGSGSGCVAGLRKDVRALRTEVKVLKRTVKRTRAAVEELSNQVFILQDRVDSNRTALTRRKGSVKLPEEQDPDPAPRSGRTGSAAGGRKPGMPASARAGSGDPVKDPAPEKRPSLKVVRLRPEPRGGSGRKDARRPVLRLYERAPVRGSSLPSIAVTERLPVVPLPSVKGPVPPSGPIEEYKASYALYLKGRYKEAAARFSAFAHRHPKHDYADNALFWLGQCLDRQGQYRKALWVFRTVVKKYPSGNKVPDSLLKMGLTYVKLGLKDRARGILEQVVRLYPKTRVARIAGKALRGLVSG